MTDRERKIHEAKRGLIAALDPDARLDSAMADEPAYIHAYLMTRLGQPVPPGGYARVDQAAHVDGTLEAARADRAAARRAMYRDAESRWDPQSEHRVKRD